MEHTEDEDLLEELGQALRAQREVPAEIIRDAEAIYTWRTVDGELAALTYDSSDAPAAAGSGLRGESAALRRMSFESPTVMLEVDILPDGLIGQVVPAQAGAVEVQAATGTLRSVPVDELGGFRVSPCPSGLFRLACRLADGLVVVGDWIRL